MSRAGRNTPRSVLVYIDAVWARNEPPDPIALARELGYHPTGIRRLKEKHGDEMLSYLLGVQRRRSERARFMARQHGTSKPEQYVNSPHGAIDDLEAVDHDTLTDLTARARGREADAAAELLVAVAEMRAACKSRIDANPTFMRQYSRDIWTLFSRLDALERNVQRRNAAA